MPRGPREQRPLRLYRVGRRGLYCDESDADVVQNLRNCKNVRWGSNGLTKRPGFRWRGISMNSRFCRALADEAFNLIEDWTWVEDDNGVFDVDATTPFSGGSFTANDYLYVGHAAPFMEVFFSQQGGKNVQTSNTLWTIEYYNGTDWKDLSAFPVHLDRYLDATDGTNQAVQDWAMFFATEYPLSLEPYSTAEVNYSTSGFIWRPPPDWAQTAADGITTGSIAAYYVRMRPASTVTFSGSVDLTPSFGFSYKDREFDNDSNRITTHCMNIWGESTAVVDDPLVAYGGMLGLFIDREDGRANAVVRRMKWNWNMMVGDLALRDDMQEYDGFMGSPTYFPSSSNEVYADMAVDPNSGRVWMTTGGLTTPINWYRGEESEAAVETDATLKADYTDSGVTLRTTVPQAKYVAAHDERIFLADDEQVFWSGPLEYSNVWPSTQFRRIHDSDGSPITGMLSHNGVLLVFKRDSVWQLTWAYDESSRVSFYQQHKIADVGAVGHRAIVQADNEIYFLSETGIYTFSNGTVVDISEPIRTFLGQTNRAAWKGACGAYWKERGEVYFCLPKSSNINEQAFVLDVKDKTWWRDDGYKVAAIAYVEDKADRGTLFFFDYENMLFEMTESKVDYPSGIPAAIDANFETHNLLRENPDYGHVPYIYVIGKHLGSYNLTFQVTHDDGRGSPESKSVPLRSHTGKYWGDGSTWAQLEYDQPRTDLVRLNYKGKSRTIRLKASENTLYQDFAITDLELRRTDREMT